jgi:membrane protein implicated in regulation of membrane protease activity
MEKISGKKTYTMAIGAIAVAVGTWLQSPETMPLSMMIQIVITSLLAVFLRSGVKKAEDAAGE